MTLLVLSAAVGGTELGGEIGIDLKSLAYKTSYSDTSATFAIGRSQSNHYANLFLSGAIVNSHFANYSTNFRLYGTYFNSSTDNATEIMGRRPFCRKRSTLFRYTGPIIKIMHCVMRPITGLTGSDCSRNYP